MYNDSPPIWLGAACTFLEAHAARPVTLSELASATDTEPERLVQDFRRYLGFTPTEFHDELRALPLRPRALAPRT